MTTVSYEAELEVDKEGEMKLEKKAGAKLYITL
jgi:hypothetical protein